MIEAFGGPEGYFSLAIIAFRGFLNRSVLVPLRVPLLHCKCRYDYARVHLERGIVLEPQPTQIQGKHMNKSGPEKGVITKGVFSLEESLESLKSLSSLDSLANGRILLYVPQSGDSLKSLESLNYLESLEHGLF